MAELPIIMILPLGTIFDIIPKPSTQIENFFGPKLYTVRASEPLKSPTDPLLHVDPT